MLEFMGGTGVSSFDLGPCVPSPTPYAPYADPGLLTYSRASEETLRAFLSGLDSAGAKSTAH